MKLRRLAAAALAAAALAAAASVPFAATPASAHGLCYATPEVPDDESGGIYGWGGIFCYQEEFHFTMTVCLQYSPVDVAALFTPSSCSTYTYDDDAHGIQFFGASAQKGCPYQSGYWRTRVTGTVGGTDHLVDNTSSSLLVVSTCPV